MQTLSHARDEMSRISARPFRSDLVRDSTMVGRNTQLDPSGASRSQEGSYGIFDHPEDGFHIPLVVMPERPIEPSQRHVGTISR